ncbi:MAG: gliding motility-associated-like protein [Crocinitomicaceae bacterium]|jgi:gliding motility-associated-like protein
MRSLLLFALISIGISFSSQSQCNTNVTICTPGVAGPFNFGVGSPNPSSCLDYLNGAGAAAYGYIVLYITQGGPLNLLIDGDLTNGCLDVAIFDVTGQADPCASLGIGTEIGCNYASACDGCNEFGSNFPCLSEVPAPMVSTGDVLMILVEDWDGTMTNFTLELSNAPGSAQTGPPPPTINLSGPYCLTDPPVQLTAATMGGTWTGPGVTAGGMFNPATAGVGNHVIDYSVGTAPCDATDQTVITVENCDCSIDAVFSIATACNPLDNTFSVNGTVEFTLPPATGTLVVEDCNGNQSTIAAPFVSPWNYTIAGILSDGTTNCAVTAFFSDDPTCTLTSAPYDNPNSCVCSVDAGPNQTICDGVQTTLNASGLANYVWDNGVIDGVPFNPPLGTTTYTVTATDAGGCVTNDQVDITVIPAPTVDAGIDQTMCDGIQATLFGGPGIQAYLWDNGVIDGIAFNSPIGTTTYTVTVTDGNGCSTSDQVDVTVNPIPVVDAGPDQSLCDGTLATLSGSGAITYVWDHGVIDGVPFAPPIGTTIYNVIGDALGCLGADNVSLTVIATTPVSFTADTLSGCQPHSVNFTNTSGGIYTNCEWDFGNGTTLTGCGTANTTLSAGTYDITLTTTEGNGCANSVTYADYIYVEAAPQTAFFPSDFELSLLNTNVNFINTTTGGVYYEWIFGDGSAGSNEVNPAHTYPNDFASSYMITLIAYSPMGCVDSTSLFISTQEELIFYLPNTFTPDGDEFNQSFQPIFSSGYDPYDFTMTIYNRWGEIVFVSNDVTAGWDGTYGGAKEVQDGTYNWTIEVKTIANDERVSVQGHVNVIR